ncbi:MAG: HEAT repeat domain-containing protein [Cyanobacteriota bacterium]
MDAKDNTEFQAYLETPDSESSLQPLLNALSDEKSYVRARAVRELGKIGTEAAVSALLDALNHKDSNVCGWAAWALGQIGSQAVITQLIATLNHEGPEVRTWAIWALGQIRSPAAVTGLIDALKHKDSQVRWRAASALGLCSGEAIVEVLIGVLNDPDSYVREKAAVALGKIGSEAAIPWLIDALNDEEFSVRGTAAQALKQIGTEGVVTGLGEALCDRDTDFRKRAIWILWQIGSESAITLLLGALNDKDSQVREKADSALWKIGLKTDNTEILQALQDKGFTAPKSALTLSTSDTDEVCKQLRQDSIELASSLQQEQATPGGNELPQIFITSCVQATDHLLCPTRGPLVKHLISIGSPGDKPPEGFTQVPHQLRLEFDDMAAPEDDPKYALPTSEDIRKVIDFIPLISQDGGNVLIHCRAGISRSSAVALTLCAVLLGEGKEEEALAHVLEVRPLAVPNLWIVELADEALGREGKLVEVVQRFHDSLWEDD